MSKLTNWIYDNLPAIDKQLENIDIDQRPFNAFIEIRKKYPQEYVCQNSNDIAVINMADPLYEEIKAWYADYYGIVCTKNFFESLFYIGNRFFEIKIPLYCLNEHKKIPENDLSLPYSIELKDKILDEYIIFWSVCIDYIRGYTRAISNKSIDKNILRLIKTAHEKLNEATVGILANSNSDQYQQSLRFSTEIHLKLITAYFDGGEDHKLKKYGHDLNKILKRCCELKSNNKTLSTINDELNLTSLYPSISKRYDYELSDNKKTWNLYKISFLIALEALSDFVVFPFSEQGALLNQIER